MGLDIGMFGAEEFFGPLDGEGFDLVHILAAAVIAGAGIALGIFIGQMAPHGLHDGGRDEVLRGDQLDMIPLPSQLAHHRAVDLGVLCFDMLIVHGENLLCFCCSLRSRIIRSPLPLCNLRFSPVV